MKYSVSGIPYNYALGLINDLRKSGIEANITAGGVSIWAIESQIETARSICKEHGAGMYLGQTEHQATIYQKVNVNQSKLQTLRVGECPQERHSKSNN